MGHLIAFDPHLMYSFLPGVPETISKRHRKAPPTDKWMVPVAGGSYLIIYEFIYIYMILYAYILI